VAEKRDEDDNVIDTAEGSAGGPKTHDPAGTRLRAETPGMLSQEELDRRQEQLRTTRRSGGPDLGKRGSGRSAAADEQAEEIPPTETEEPPARSP
jgi:hypothetical protein